MFLESATNAFLAQLAFVLNKSAPRIETLRTLSDSKLQRVLSYIEGNLDHNITLAELADLVDLTPRYFCGVFKHSMGRPPHQYQIELRVERAKELLQKPFMSLNDVALMVGFSSQSHLNLHFRRIVGVTPARFRAEALPRRAHWERPISRSL